MRGLATYVLLASLHLHISTTPLPRYARIFHHIHSTLMSVYARTVGCKVNLKKQFITSKKDLDHILQNLEAFAECCTLGVLFS